MSHGFVITSPGNGRGICSSNFSSGGDAAPATYFATTVISADADLLASAVLVATR